MDDELYQEQILDHYKNPRHKQELKDAAFHNHQLNPSCGDDLTLYVKIKKDKTITVTFQGHGCAISQASASLLTEYLNNKTIEEIKNLTEENIYTLLGIPISPARKKCALLSFVTLKNGLNIYLNNSTKNNVINTNIIKNNNVKNNNTTKHNNTNKQNKNR